LVFNTFLSTVRLVYYNFFVIIKFVHGKKDKKRQKKTSFWFKLNHLFKPQASNKYRSGLLHPQSLLVLSFILLAVFSLFNTLRFFPSLADKVLGFSSNVDVNGLLVATNKERANLNLAPLAINEKIKPGSFGQSPRYV
jgi:hypothetical protein